MYKCPLCNGKLTSAVGCRGHENDENYGMTLFCPEIKCPAQEVMGHGKTEKDAYEIILEKFVKRNSKKE